MTTPEAFVVLRDLGRAGIRLERRGDGWVMVGGRPEGKLAEDARRLRDQILAIVSSRPAILYWRLSGQVAKIGLPGVKTHRKEYNGVLTVATHFSLPDRPSEWIPLEYLPESYWSLVRPEGAGVTTHGVENDDESTGESADETD